MADEPVFDRADESLLYSFSELLGRLNVTVDMATLRSELAGEDLNFDVLAEGENVHITDRGEYGSWPTSNNAIIRFQYQDNNEPYIEIDGNREANIIDHYCLVADFEQRTIIDSANGAIREGNQYGQPVSWAMFDAGLAAAAPAPKIDAERTYRVLSGGESGWQIARKLGISGTELKEHNEDDLEDFSNIPEGTLLHLPFTPEAKPKSPITEFEFLRRPLEMHVSRPGGTRKYSFGNAKKAEDIKETGPHAAENKNLLIYAIAHVPIGDEVYGYYMESGDIDSSGKKVKWTVGFNHTHLADGHVEQVKSEFQIKPEIQAQLDVKLAEAEQARAVADAAEEENNPPSKRQGSDSLPLDDPEYTSDWWQTTFKPLNEDGVPEVYLFNNDVVVTDLAGQCRNKLLRKLDGVRIAGTFTGPDNKTYWRPQDAISMRTWYGIPVLDPETGEPVLISEAELFNTTCLWPNGHR
jgi:hypothetical protein